MKITLNRQISSSRLPNEIPKFVHRDIVADQIADILIRRDRRNVYSLIYLPMDYARQNPGYLPYILDEAVKEQKKMESNNRIMVVVLMEQ
jgi:hypothetical protein